MQGIVLDASVASAPVGEPRGWPGRIVLADDHPLVRRALGEAARTACPGAIVAEVETLAQLVAALRADPDVALVLLDLRLPDCSGFAGLRAIRERFPAVPVAVVSALEDELTVGGALDLGASGFIPKSARVAELTNAIVAILNGEIWSPTTLRGTPCGSERLIRAALTPAQLRIASALQRGLPNKQIAYELGVTEATVKAHMTATFRKLGVTSRVQAMTILAREPPLGI